MNALGIALVWCAMQVTLFALLVAVIYLLARGLRPAAAAPIVLTGLGTIVVLSLLAFSPWPRWPLAEAIRPADVAAASEQDSTPVDDLEFAASLASAPLPDGAMSHSQASVRQPTFIKSLLAPPANAADGWRWPAVVAVVFLVFLAFGLAWLLLGLLAVRAERRRSLPLDDRELIELVDVLRAELGCLRAIAIRQSGSLVTAAMIGWRRATLLVPPDWRTWTEDERRAVLAHEIAHARDHDCLAALCGQFALMLHVYHPLLHWLADRLRLEQELAADAAAASVSGGQQRYLATIAALALRQQDRSLLWPARTFLPSRTTFLRRIAMLRDNKLSVGRRSTFARAFVVGIVLFGGLAVAGVRGPLMAAEPKADKPSAKQAEGGAVRLGYTGNTSTDKRSIGGSGHAIAFHRPAEAKYLGLIQIYASRYGMPQAPREDFHVYVLDKNKKMIDDFLFPYSMIARGQQAWQRLYVPATEVPEDFYIALSFDPHQTKGIYLGLDKNVESSHSFIGLPEAGYQPVPEKYDWMVQAIVVPDAKKVKAPRGATVGRRGQVSADKAGDSSFFAPADADEEKNVARATE